MAEFPEHYRVHVALWGAGTAPGRLGVANGIKTGVFNRQHTEASMLG